MSSAKKETIPETPFEKEKEANKATKDDANDAAASAKESKVREPRVFRERRHNVIVVRSGMKFRTLVIQAKNLLKKQFDTVELHGVDD